MIQICLDCPECLTRATLDFSAMLQMARTTCDMGKQVCLVEMHCQWVTKIVRATMRGKGNTFQVLA